MTEYITHGQANWDGALNDLLTKLSASTDDTGWVSLTLMNGFQNQVTNSTRVRKIGNMVFLRIAVVNITNDTVLGKLPDQFISGATGQYLVRTTGDNAFGVTIGYDGTILAERSVTRTTVDSKDYLNGILTWIS